jgi:hypothetical protein
MALMEIFGDSRGLGRCRSCGKPITWAEMVKSGKKMPFDGDELIAVRTGKQETDWREIWTIDTDINPSHFATCPDAKLWRR